jgi:hypothetical protein
LSRLAALSDAFVALVSGSSLPSACRRDLKIFAQNTKLVENFTWSLVYGFMSISISISILHQFSSCEKCSKISRCHRARMRVQLENLKQCLVSQATREIATMLYVEE